MEELWGYTIFIIIPVLLYIYIWCRDTFNEYKRRKHFEDSYHKECEKNKNQKAIITVQQAQEALRCCGFDERLLFCDI